METEYSCIYDADKEPNRDHFGEIREELSREFRRVQSNNPLGCVDSFEQSFWTHCETVAKRLNIRLMVGRNNEPCFDFVNPRTVGEFREWGDALRNPQI